MKTFDFIRELIIWIVCVIVFTLAILSMFHLKVLIVPVEYQYKNIDEMIHLIENYRMYYLNTNNYIDAIQHDADSISVNRLKRDYYRYKDSVVWDNEDYSSSIEYCYPKK